MSDQRKNGTNLIVRELMRKEGYSRRKADRLVKTFILILWDKLTDGKRIKIDGLGTLATVRRTPKLAIRKNLAYTPTCIVTLNKQPKSVRLIKPVDLTYKEK